MTVSTEGALAVIGLAGRFPGAEGLDTFWRNKEFPYIGTPHQKKS